MTRSYTSALATLTTLAIIGSVTTASAQGTMYVRPDGNGYYYHQGPGPLRPPAFDPYVDDIIVHQDLDRREYERRRIYDTGVRHGQLTPAQRAALANELRQSGERDEAYHSGYHRGRAPIERYPVPYVRPLPLPLARPGFGFPPPRSSIYGPYRGR